MKSTCSMVPYFFHGQNARFSSVRSQVICFMAKDTQDNAKKSINNPLLSWLQSQFVDPHCSMAGSHNAIKNHIKSIGPIYVPHFEKPTQSMAKNSSAAAVELASPGGLHHVPTLHERRLGGLSGASHPGSGRLRGSAAAPVHLGALEGKKRGMEWHRIAIL